MIVGQCISEKKTKNVEKIRKAVSHNHRPNIILIIIKSRTTSSQILREVLHLLAKIMVGQSSVIYISRKPL